MEYDVYDVSQIRVPAANIQHLCACVTTQTELTWILQPHMVTTIRSSSPRMGLSSFSCRTCWKTCFLNQLNLLCSTLWMFCVLSDVTGEDWCLLQWSVDCVPAACGCLNMWYMKLYHCYSVRKVSSVVWQTYKNQLVARVWHVTAHTRLSSWWFSRHKEMTSSSDLLVKKVTIFETWG